MNKIPDVNHKKLIRIIKMIILGQAKELYFTHDTPTNNKLQFLDMQPTSQNYHVC